MFTRLLAEVVGVGLLLCVPVLVDQPSDAASWLLACLIGLCVGVATRSALAHRAEMADRDVLSADPRELDVVNGWYVGGILAGQVFLCGFAGHVIGRTTGLDGSGGCLGIGVLVLSGLLAFVRPAIQDRTKRARMVLTLLTALAWSWWPAAAGTMGPALLVDAPGPLATGLLFFVSIVGWEARRSWSPGEFAAGRRVILPVFLVVAAIGTGLALLRLARADTGEPGVVGPLLTILVSLLAVSYCRTNLVAAGTLAAEVRGRGSARTAPMAGSVLLVALFLFLAELYGWKIGSFLYGPAAMTSFIFFWLTARIAVRTDVRVGARVAGLAAAGVLLALSPALGPAILLPVAVGVVIFGRRAMVRSGAPGTALERGASPGSAVFADAREERS